MIAPVLHFSRAEFEQRIKITRQEMELRGLSLLILSDPSNMNWLTGCMAIRFGLAARKMAAAPCAQSSCPKAILSAIRITMYNPFAK